VNAVVKPVSHMHTAVGNFKTMKIMNLASDITDVTS